MLLVTFVPLGIDGECNPDKEVAKITYCYSSDCIRYLSYRH